MTTILVELTVGCTACIAGLYLKRMVCPTVFCVLLLIYFVGLLPVNLEQLDL